MEKLFSPEEVEARVYAAWEEAGLFRAGALPAREKGAKADAKSFCIVLPPPNVTGSLHIGHALNLTLQDILIRWRRMQGRDTLWQPGTDHAGIATQMLVERQLEKEGLDRRDIGRDAFLERVWEWKAQSGGRIRDQMRRLGASCDWERDRFTLDAGLSAAVRQVFVALHRDGLVYKDKRLVNWDPALRTAISDLEVIQEPVASRLWHIRYEVEGGGHVTIATTRPETMFADTAIAVHPEDARYAGLVGGCAILPLLGRRLPIVADAYVDPEEGSGALKVTPGHDFNDFDIGKRHGLDIVNVLDEGACLNEVAPEAYRGMERMAAREKLVKELEARGLVERVEEREGSVPVGDRSGSVIEPWLTEQWYVDAGRLAGEAIRAVEDGRVVFVPRLWEKTYFDWMRRIEPWCVSRQLWWGHRIPAWYGEDGEVFVAESEAEAAALARAHYGREVALRQDEDVLDTWFSSALWPFSTLGWPEETAELERYFPTDVLVTSFDIIFFWVARMMMFALYFRREIPFSHVYIHALVRDAKGQKMSKSKGNAIDPLEAVEKFGADAVRFTLASMESQGRDIKLSEGRIKGYRNFTTKLWNAARFCRMNECVVSGDFAPEAASSALNRWAVGETAALSREMDAALEAYRFNEAAGAAYRFVWHQFCDWYLEFAKEEFAKGGAAADETRGCAGWVLGRVLALLHPFMPFVTEETYARMGGEGMLAGAAYPLLGGEGEGAEMEPVFALVRALRSERALMGVPDAEKVGLDVEEETAAQREYAGAVARLGKVWARGEGGEGAGAAFLVTAHGDGGLTWRCGEGVDREALTARLRAGIAAKEKELGAIEKVLGNPEFLAKAEASAVEEKRQRARRLEQERDRQRELLGDVRL